jgi:hypothetical protein
MAESNRQFRPYVSMRRYLTCACTLILPVLATPSCVTLAGDKAVSLHCAPLFSFLVQDGDDLPPLRRAGDGGNLLPSGVRAFTLDFASNTATDRPLGDVYSTEAFDVAIDLKTANIKTAAEIVTIRIDRVTGVYDRRSWANSANGEIGKLGTGEMGICSVATDHRF